MAGDPNGNFEIFAQDGKLEPVFNFFLEIYLQTFAESQITLRKFMD